MAVISQELHEYYAIYHGDCITAMQAMPAASVHLAIYSLPFCGLFHYTSSEYDLSNCRTYEEFLEHYEFVVRELHRLLLPGRICAVHCMDVPDDGANYCGYRDFPGDIIRIHQKVGFDYLPRICIWKEPLEVRNRTMLKSLAHRTIVEDSTRCTVASADYLIPFRKRGENPVPVAHPVGLLHYAGARQMPYEVLKYKAWKGHQTENKYSHWIWRNYASCFWDDIRLGRVLPYKEARDSEDEQHLHPLQLDVIDRALVLWSNPGEVVLSPFAGVGSEVYGAVANGRKGVGIELKDSYYRQAVKNLHAAVALREQTPAEQATLFDALPEQSQSSEDMLPSGELAPEPDEPVMQSQEVATSEQISPELSSSEQSLDAWLKAALFARPGCAPRWADRKRSGLDDQSLRRALAAEWQDNPSMEIPGMPVTGYRTRGGSKPAFWVLPCGPRAKPALEGKALVEAVRRVMGIPEPTGATMGEE